MISTNAGYRPFESVSYESPSASSSESSGTDTSSSASESEDTDREPEVGEEEEEGPTKDGSTDSLLSSIEVEEVHQYYGNRQQMRAARRRRFESQTPLTSTLHLAGSLVPAPRAYGSDEWPRLMGALSA
jgi:hypothetical protein